MARRRRWLPWIAGSDGLHLGMSWLVVIAGIGVVVTVILVVWLAF